MPLQFMVTADAVSRGMTDRLVNHVFGGSLASVVSHLLESRDVEADELEELEALIQAHRQRKNSPS